MTGRVASDAVLRTERPGDQAAIAAVHRAAFGREDEADLVDALRDGGHLVLSLVAEAAVAVVGSVVFSRLWMEAAGRRRPGVALAPVAVLPERQGEGIGAVMIAEGLARLGRDGEAICFVLGDPGYYRRFGFAAERAAGFDCVYAGPAFMALELGAAEPVKLGTVIYPHPFATVG